MATWVPAATCFWLCFNLCAANKLTTYYLLLDQYALSLQGTGSKMMEKSLGSSDFPSADVAGALGPRVRRASVQMEAIMGLWRPSLDHIRLT